MSRHLLAASLLAVTLSGCGGQLNRIGVPPETTEIEPLPTQPAQPSIASQQLADRITRQTRQPAEHSASLFRTGAGALFRDQRASEIGDILTIRINIQDSAQLGNTTSRTRGGGESASVASLLGLTDLLPDSIDPTNLAETSSSSTFNGGGNTVRSESIDMTMAAIVTDVLPNGALAIRGRQEVRVNFELRELIVTGIVRPQDIGRDNSILHSQIAEARIIYGGRGQLTDAQQARWGQQIYDALFPF
ncbi:flagellar basal body L-ring protein [Pacificimonas flava]|uniref:Flagellar L-ring protein n=2 Tax=Pacificimonas TaxID=1960290 RepID=A0A219B6Y7_9SPHN|nr:MULTISPECIES: flagellar basal body L-ring protein FlgH [Pacificimonas]MBZ6379238.1 flagellar basal body L-ring protein FlgH [Pacificimonas aurantium]OWV33548.1 flagellar basal body L-ring protein [Pacificimonas flava]